MDMRTTIASAAILVVGILAGSGGQALAAGESPNSLGPAPGQTFDMSTGPAFTTGNVGSLQTTTLPGSAGQGLLMNNGNGTSTLIVPGGVPQTVASPR
jgi:hypothetical protein